MGILIVSITLILYILLIVFTFHNLGFITDNKIKLMVIAISLVILFIITFVIFSISANGISYDKHEVLSKIRGMLLAVFVPVNGLFTMPYIASVLNKLYSKEMEQTAFNKRIIILVVIFILILIFECSYFKSIQQGIVNMMNE